MSMSREYQLEKWVWTEADFDRMGWHDCPIHGISTVSEFSDRLELLLDLDYIFEWINQGAGRPLAFRVAPATLVFENVYSLRMDIDSRQAGLNLDELRREGEEHAPDETTRYWRWNLDLHEGNIRFLSSGFRQYVRKQPVLAQGRQLLDLKSRGGVSFDRPTGGS